MKNLLTLEPGVVVTVTEGAEGTNGANHSTGTNPISEKQLYGVVLTERNASGEAMVRVGMKELLIHEGMLEPIQRESLSQDALEEITLPVGTVVFIENKQDVDVLNESVEAVVIGANDEGKYFVEVLLDEKEKLWLTLSPDEFSLSK